MYGHFVNVPTHFNVKLPLISGHLPNADADSHLLVVSTCYNGQCKQMPRTFSVVISTKNRWRAPKLGTDSSLKCPCCRLVTNEQYVTSSRLINYVIAANHPLHWLRLFHDINGKVTYSVCLFDPRCRRTERFFVGTN